jgi:zinc transporter 9
VAVLLEDSAAIIGLVIATACTGLTYVTGNVVYDGIGSILIGGLLGATAVFLIRKNTMYAIAIACPIPLELCLLLLLLQVIVGSIYAIS